MMLSKLALTGTVALAMIGAPAVAQDKAAQDKSGEQSGQVTQVNRLNSTISLRPVQEGTVGANTAGSETQFKVKDPATLEDLHAGNRITYSATGDGDNRTITNFKRQQ